MTWTLMLALQSSDAVIVKEIKELRAQIEELKGLLLKNSS
jgi:hypothetical protein